MKGSGRRRVCTAVLLAAVAGVAMSTLPAIADGQAVLEGTIYDMNGVPVAGCRVIVRAADQTGIYVSLPSDQDGRYSVSVPGGGSYLFEAAVSRTGGRTPIPDSPRVDAVEGRLTQDLHLTISALPGPRQLARAKEASDRLILSFVEDPLLVERRYGEARVEAASWDSADQVGVSLIAAVQVASLPRVEFGGRTGYTSISGDAGAPDGSGARDLELWGKIHLARSSDGKLDWAAGGLFTVPTGDDDEGIGMDAFQSKLFIAASYSLSSAAIVGHVGLRVTQDGSVGGSSVEGQVSPAVAAGVVVPFSPRLSLLFEASHDGERFEDAEAESMVSFGANWRLHMHGTVRGALAGGLADGSPDVQLLVGYAREF